LQPAWADGSADRTQDLAQIIEAYNEVTARLQHSHEMLTKDERRAFNEAERIAIYRRDNGLCQMCVAEEKPEKECRVPWSEYDADHVIPHSKGGKTEIENAQVLCRYHNQQKGAKRE
jgi:hypothetical protein